MPDPIGGSQGPGWNPIEGDIPLESDVSSLGGASKEAKTFEEQFAQGNIQSSAAGLSDELDSLKLLLEGKADQDVPGRLNAISKHVTALRDNLEKLYRKLLTIHHPIKPT